MKEPLTDGWKKERYNYHEALRIVIYWRYDGPHPATELKPSHEARSNAGRDIQQIIKSEPVAIANSKPRRQGNNWVNAWKDASGFGKRGWGLHEQDSTIETEPNSVRYVSFILFDDLIALCPGVFIADKDTSAIRNGKIILEIAKDLKIDVLNIKRGHKKILKEECLKRPKDFTPDIFEHAWKARKTWATPTADICPHSTK